MKTKVMMTTGLFVLVLLVGCNKEESTDAKAPEAATTAPAEVAPAAAPVEAAPAAPVVESAPAPAVPATK